MSKLNTVRDDYVADGSSVNSSFHNGSEGEERGLLYVGYGGSD